MGILAFTVGVVEVARIIWSNRIRAAMALLGRLYLRQARRAFSGAAAAQNQVAVVSTEPAPCRASCSSRTLQTRSIIIVVSRQLIAHARLMSEYLHVLVLWYPDTDYIFFGTVGNSVRGLLGGVN